MNIKGLRAFTRIMATGTLGAAAKSLHVSESALSRQLSLLEAELKLVLFSREKRRLVPTPEGEAFFAEAERILDSIEQIPEIANQIRRGPRRRMRIVAMPRIAATIAVPAISKFHDEHPDMEISLEIHPRRYMERWLASQQFDLGIGSLPSNHAAIETEHICRVPAVAVLPAGHALASRRSVHVTELSGDRFIMMPRTTLIGDQSAKILEQANFEPASQIQVSETPTTCSFAAQGFGVTIADALIPQVFGASVSVVPIEPKAFFDFGLLYPRDAKRTREIDRLIDLIKGEATSCVAGLGFD